MNAQLARRALSACALGAAATLVALASLGTPARATETPWSLETDCTTCHDSQATSIVVPTHEALGCSICHSDEDALAEVHSDVDEETRAPRRLKTTDVADAVCLGCHGDGTIAAPDAGQSASGEKTAEAPATTEGNDVDAKATEAAAPTATPSENKAQADADSTKGADQEQDEPGRTALIAATADSTVLTDEKGTTVNPHDLPAVEDHASINCIDCHKGHSSDTIEVSAMKACTLCHHENVFECYTCHE